MGTMKEDLVIKAGKYYKTRDGRKAEVFCTDFNEGFYQVQGRIYEKNGEQIMFSWNKEGKSLINGRGDYDLVSEWDEPSYRPYNWEEAQGLIGEVVRRKSGDMITLICGLHYNGTAVFFINGSWISALALLEGFTHNDGSPCGYHEP